jgi:hypothetical protein
LILEGPWLNQLDNVIVRRSGLGFLHRALSGTSA